MKQPLLSILIPTTPDREQSTKDLMNKIVGEYYSYDCYLYQTGNIAAARHESKVLPIELVIYLDSRQLTIGEKREMLYDGAKGEYSWQIDSDDTIATDAIEKILKAIEEGPDCITFQEHCTINGQFFSSNHSLKYDDWGEKQDGFDYVRTPFMKSVIKTEIARSVPIPHIRYGEDHEWARALKPHLKTEVHIPEYLYFYQHNSKPEDHNERYGIT